MVSLYLGERSMLANLQRGLWLRHANARVPSEIICIVEKKEIVVEITGAEIVAPLRGM